MADDDEPQAAPQARQRPPGKDEASAEASPGTATGRVSSSSRARPALPGNRVSTQASGTPNAVLMTSVNRATSKERPIVSAYRDQTSAIQRSVNPLDRPIK